jgi:hypothetical protein
MFLIWGMSDLLSLDSSYLGKQMREKGTMENTEKFDLKKVAKEEHCLIAPCGIYCGACDIFLGRTRELARELYRIMKGFNFADVGHILMGIEQQKIQDFLDILEKWSLGEKCAGCWKDAGWKPEICLLCSIKVCAEKQGFLSCAECSKMPCHESRGDEQTQAAERLGIVTLRYAHWNIDNLKRIREVGYRRFIDEMQKKVKKRFITSDVISSDPIVAEYIKRMKG